MMVIISQCLQVSNDMKSLHYTLGMYAIFTCQLYPNITGKNVVSEVFGSDD